MDDFTNILQRDFGLRPQGKAAPMTSSAKQAAPFSSSSSPSSTPASIHRTSSGGKSKNGSNRNSRSSTPILGESLQDDLFFGSSNGFNSTSSTQNNHGSAVSNMPDMYDDVFGGPPKFSSTSFPTMPSSRGQQASASQSYDDIFRVPAQPAAASTAFVSTKGSTFPVFDAPLYDDDIFGGVPGIRSTGVVYDDVFSGGSTVGTSPIVLEDLLGVSQSRESRDRPSNSQPSNLDSERPSAGASDFDELLPGFSGSEPAQTRPNSDGKPSQGKSSGVEQNSLGMSFSDPFDVLQVDDSFKVPESTSSQASAPLAPEPDASKVSTQPPSGGYGSKRYLSNDHQEEKFATSRDTSPRASPSESPSMSDSTSSNAMHTDVLDEKHPKRNQPSNDDRTRISRSPKPFRRDSTKASSFHSPLRRTHDDGEELAQPTKVADSRSVDEFWITVDDVKLATQPTAAPPPTRQPPLPGFKHSKKTASRFKNSASSHESPQSAKVSSSSAGVSQHLKRSNINNVGGLYNDLEEFAQGVSRPRKENKMDMSAKTLEDEIVEGTAAVSASSMAMKEAAERARAKLRERVKEEKESPGIGESQENVDESRIVEEGTREEEEKEREAKAIREKEERERRHREKEERDKERLKDRIAVERAAVERATAEARERAAADAKQRAAVERAVAEARERAAAEAREKAAVEARQRAAVERATAEARERAAADARERAAAEARERAAAEARERAAMEKAAAERAAVERATSEARARAERVAFERAHAEVRERAAEKVAADARERAASEAREKAAERASSAAREQQRRNENDLEAFFASTSRPGSAPRQRSPSQSAPSDVRQSSKGFSSTDGTQRSSTAAPAAKKATPTSSTDDWTSLFGPSVSASGEFPDVEGENAERRRARWERHQRTAERVARAVSEKNQRDLQSQREQEERHRAGEILDAEIKRWAAGKEGNLRALLSTLQYVLWPECGWQAVSLTDLITAAAVKKVYRKATLFVHPDKVQQKGATIQQKYVAEKVFDLLKEAWNKFNSEELF